MKRVIYASRVTQLTIAKGVVITPSDTVLRNKMESQYSEHQFDNGYSYLFYTKGNYNVQTGQLDVNILNHQSLITKYGLDNVPDSCILYFSVELNPDGRSTSLQVRGAVHSPKTTAKLARMFNTSEKISTGDLVQYSVTSADFKSWYSTAAKETRADLKAYHDRTNRYTEEYADETYAVCICVIDPTSQIAYVDKDGDTLFKAYSYEEYRSLANKVAKQLGHKVSELDFKTVYGYHYGTKSHMGSGAKLANEKYKWINKFKNDPEFIEAGIQCKYDKLNGAAGLILKIGRGKYRGLSLLVTNTVIEPEISRDNYLSIPENYLNHYDEIAQMVLDYLLA